MDTTMTQDDLEQKIYHAMKLAEGATRGDYEELIQVRVKVMDDFFYLGYESATAVGVIAALFEDGELYVRPQPGPTWSQGFADYVESTGIMQLLRHVQRKHCYKTRSGAWKFRTN